MKVVTNIDTCRKSYEVIDSPFKDIRTRYNELPGEIKECFATEEILNRSLLDNKITKRTLVNLWNKIRDVFLDKLDISEYLIDEYVLKYDLNKERVKAINQFLNLIGCIHFIPPLY